MSTKRWRKVKVQQRHTIAIEKANIILMYHYAETLESISIEFARNLKIYIEATKYLERVHIPLKWQKYFLFSASQRKQNLAVEFPDQPATISEGAVWRSVSSRPWIFVRLWEIWGLKNIF